MAEFEGKEAKKEVEGTESLKDMSFNSENRTEEKAPKKAVKATGDEKAKKNGTKKTKVDSSDDGAAPKKSSRKKTDTVEDGKEKRSRKKTTTDIVEEKKDVVADAKKEEKIEVASVTLGNYMRGRGNSYKCSYDVVVRTNAGHVLYYIFIDDKHGGCFTNSPASVENLDDLLQSEPIDLKDPKEVSLVELPDMLTRAIFERLYPEGSEEEYLKFVYGEEQGALIYEDYKWAEEHPISSDRDVTLNIRDEIGEIQDIHLDGTKWINYKQERRELYYTITDGQGDKWNVIVFENKNDRPPYDSYEIERC